MDVFHKLEDVPAAFGPSLVSVGNFDGVHRAHVHVLGEIVRRARESATQAVAVTFEPHPARILRPDSAVKLLTPLPEKLRLLEVTGIDAVFWHEFLIARQIDSGHCILRPQPTPASGRT